MPVFSAGAASRPSTSSLVVAYSNSNADDEQAEAEGEAFHGPVGRRGIRADEGGRIGTRPDAGDRASRMTPVATARIGLIESMIVESERRWTFV